MWFTELAPLIGKLRFHRDGDIAAVFGDQRQFQLEFALSRIERPIAKEPS